jgi:DeoR family transcriptional regulator of aga operon
MIATWSAHVLRHGFVDGIRLERVHRLLYGSILRRSVWTYNQHELFEWILNWRIVQPEVRQQQILSQLLALQSELSVEELVEKFGVSALTIRRDLDQLERDGAILRTHGGCVLRNAVESSYHQRVGFNFALKQEIGRAAAKEVESGDVILLDYGSTAFHLAPHLSGVGKLSVYTNSLPVISVLSRFHNVRLYILGGEYNVEMQFMGGSLMEQTLEGLRFDRVFVGTDAIDAKGNCLVVNPGLARLTEIMLRQAGRRILLADHTKVGAKAYNVYARLTDFDIWYTTQGIIPIQLRQFNQQTTVRVVNTTLA